MVSSPRRPRSSVPRKNPLGAFSLDADSFAVDLSKVVAEHTGRRLSLSAVRKVAVLVRERDAEREATKSEKVGSTA